MRNILTSAPWLSVGPIQVLSVLTECSYGNAILVRDEAGRTFEMAIASERIQKQKQAEAIGNFFLKHPDATLLTVNGEFCYTYSTNGNEQRTRLGSTPQQALILATS